MTPALIRAEIVTDKIAYIREMVAAIRQLPLSSYEEFTEDSRNAAAAESFLRRALESLFDLGRHILAKAFAASPTEYKEIGTILAKQKVISGEESRNLRVMAGYRNRMVHYYHEIGEEELYRICREDLTDIERIGNAIAQWLGEHPDKVDTSL